MRGSVSVIPSRNGDLRRLGAGIARGFIYFALRAYLWTVDGDNSGGQAAARALNPPSKNTVQPNKRQHGRSAAAWAASHIQRLLARAVFSVFESPRLQIARIISNSKLIR